MNKIKNTSKVHFVLYFLIILIISLKTNLFLNIYKILKYDLSSRLTSHYGYCYPMGYGFISKMKKQYNLNNKNLNVLNKEIFPTSLIFSFNIFLNKTNKEILLNYNQTDLKSLKKKFKILEREENCYLIEYIND